MDLIDLAPVMGLNVQALRAEVTFVCIIMACAPSPPQGFGVAVVCLITGYCMLDSSLGVLSDCYVRQDMVCKHSFPFGHKELFFVKN
jgi:hypothetical protein